MLPLCVWLLVVVLGCARWPQLTELHTRRSFLEERTPKLKTNHEPSQGTKGTCWNRPGIGQLGGQCEGSWVGRVEPGCRGLMVFVAEEM